MALSDCEKCWDTPCTCGYQFINYSQEKLVEFIKSVTSQRPDKKEIIEILTTKK